MLGNPLKPYGLPNTANRSIPHSAPFLALLSVSQSNIQFVGYANTQNVAACHGNIGNVKAKG